MSNCYVLEPQQQITDKPHKRIKRSGAHSLVNQGRAIWVKRNQLLQLISPELHKPRPAISAITYIPFGLEPNIDYQLGICVRIPSLPGQIRFRHM